VKYFLDRKDIGFAVKLFHGESDLFSDLLLFSELDVLCENHRLSGSLYPNSTENFKYVWLDLIQLTSS
jgi:hypothetical protein